MCTGCALAAALAYVRKPAAGRMCAGAPGDMQTVPLCIVVEKEQRAGTLLLHARTWRRASYAWLHRRGGETAHSYSCLCTRTHGAIETSSSCVCACIHAHLTTCEPCSDASSWRKSSKHNALVQHAQGATRGARSRSHVCMRTWQRTGRARSMSQTRLHCGGGHPVRPEAACSACVHAHLAKCEPCSLVVAQLLRRMHT
jgi:hypothetical protein